MNADDIYGEYLRAQMRPPMLEPGPPVVPPVIEDDSSDGNGPFGLDPDKLRPRLDAQAGETGTGASQQMQPVVPPVGVTGVDEASIALGPDPELDAAEFTDTVAGFSRAVLHGVDSFVDEIYKFVGAEEFGDWLESSTGGPIMMQGPRTVVEETVSDIAQTVTGMVPAARILKGLGVVSNFLKWTAAGFAADFASFDPDEPFVGELAAKIGKLDNEAGEAVRSLMQEYLEKGVDDSEFIKRLKNASGGAIIGTVADGLLFVLRGTRLLTGKGAEIREGFTIALAEHNRSLASGRPLHHATDPANLISRPASSEAVQAISGATVRMLARNPGFAQTIKDFLADESGEMPLKRRGSGQYVGAPKTLDSPQKLAALRRSVVNLYKAGKGEGSKFWYERSGRAILEMFGGDIDEAQMFAKFVAVTSPEAPVKGNLEWALRAWNQYKAGGTLQAGKYPNNIRQALESVLAGGPVTGNKRKAFYANLMTEIDPTRVPARQVTVDRWILDAFGFKRGTTPTDAQYEFVANEIRRIADNVGWEPHQVQASIWVANKAKVEGTEIDAAAFDFSTALAESRGQISWEAIPHPTTRHLVGLENMPAQVKAEYHYGAAQAFLDDNGRDILAKELGIATPGSFEAPGAYKGGVQPGEQTMLPIPWTKSKGTLDPDTVLLINTYAALRGRLLRQEGIAWHLPTYDSTIENANAIDWRGLGRILTEEETDRLYKTIVNAGGNPGWAPVPTPDGYRILNFEKYTGVSNAKFRELVGAAHDRAFADLDVTFHDFDFKSQGEYLTNDWKEFPNGEAYLSWPGKAGRPDLQKRADRLYAEISEKLDAFDAEFAQRHGLTSRPRIIEKAESQGATP